MSRTGNERAAPSPTVLGEQRAVGLSPAESAESRPMNDYSNQRKDGFGSTARHPAASEVVR